MSSYKLNEKDALKRLSEKYKKLKEAFDIVNQKLKNTSKSNAELHVAVKKATKSMHYAVDKENFLRERVIKIYGRQAYADLLNHVDCPGGFNVNAFNQATEKMKARNDEAS